MLVDVIREYCLNYMTVSYRSQMNTSWLEVSDRCSLMTKLTKELLEEMIIEVMNEVALCRNKDTGHFDDCDDGNVYSLSHDGARRAGVDKELVGRGVMTKNRKIDSPYGMNTSDTKDCGRITIQGKDKKKDRRCRDYKARGRYGITEESDSIQNIRQLVIHGDKPEAYINVSDLIGVLNQFEQIQKNQSDELVEGTNPLYKKCRELGFKSQQEYFQSLVRSLDMLKRGLDGKLYEPPKG